MKEAISNVWITTKLIFYGIGALMDLVLAICVGVVTSSFAFGLLAVTCVFTYLLFKVMFFS